MWYNILMYILQEYGLSIKNKRIVSSDSAGKFTRMDGEFSKVSFNHFLQLASALKIIPIQH